MKSLRGQLLLASGRLADPNFFRTVILVVQHSQEGALGLVLNRPLDLTVKQAVDDDLEFVCQTDEVLHQGGPCEGPLMALHADRQVGQMGLASYDQVISGLYFSTEPAELESLLKQDNPKAKFFLGYSGWSAGQLEGELENGSWLLTPATINRVLEPGETEKWSKLLTEVTLGGRIRTDLIPDDPSVN